MQGRVGEQGTGWLKLIDRMRGELLHLVDYNDPVAVFYTMAVRVGPFAAG